VHGGTALINGLGLAARIAYTRPAFAKNMAPGPARSESENPSLPGRPIGLPDLGGNVDAAQEARRQLGSNPSPAELAAAAYQFAKPAVLATIG
jgi:hypothetical protein